MMKNKIIRDLDFITVKNGNKDARYDVMRHNLPYQLTINADGKSITLVNREYLPLGSTKESFERSEVADTVLQINPNSLRDDLFFNKHGYLFNDGCSPWAGNKELEAYVHRVNHIMKEVIDE